MRSAAAVKALPGGFHGWGGGLVILAWSLRLWWLMGPYPPGLDGGNWLLMGRRLFGVGTEAIGYPLHVYPPMVPVMMFLGSLAIGVPLTAKLLAVGSVASVMGAVLWVTRRGMTAAASVAVTLLIGASFGIVEPLAFGGYPQNFAFAAGLVSLDALTDYLRGTEPTRLRVATVFLFLTGLTHHAYFLVVAATSTTLCALVLLLDKNAKNRGLRVFGAALAHAPGFLAFGFTAWAMIAAGYTAPVNAPQFSHRAAFLHVFREPHIYWYLLLSFGMLRLFLSVLERQTPLAYTGVALGATGAALFAYSAEARLLAPVLVAGAAGFGLLLGDPRRSPAFRRVAAGIGLSGLLWVGPSLDREARGVIAWFRYMDADHIELSRWLAAHAPEGLVAIGADERGFPLGWWLAGMTDARVVAGSDPRWLAFPRQRALASAIASVLDDRRTFVDAARVARAEGIDLVIAPKRSWSHWLTWALEPGARVSFENGSFIVFDARDARR